MMTPAQVTAAIERIRTRQTAEPTGTPVTTHWEETPPFAAKPNPHASRGHVELYDDDGVWCDGCHEDKPRGGWSESCPNDHRVFTGG